MLERKTSAIIFIVSISVLSGIFLWHIDSQNAFAFEENILAFQTGIISTSSQDYAVSQEFDAKIFQDGRIMRVSGVTSTGEPYYLYQKNIGDDIRVYGKILVDGNFIPLLQKTVLEEREIMSSDSKDILVLVKQPQYGYYYDTYTITAKAFESILNPRENFEQTQGYVEGIKINVTLTNNSDEQLTTFGGMTNQFGTFTGKYLWGYTDPSGQYNVTVVIDDGKSINTQYYNTFYRGFISNYTGN